MTHAQKSIAIGRWIFRYRKWIPWIVLSLATLALVITPKDQILQTTPWLQFGAFSLSLIGLLIRAFAVGFAAKSALMLKSQQKIVGLFETTAFYSVVRHPVFLGDLILWTGVLLDVGVAWFLVGMLLLLGAAYEKMILAEEEIMCRRFGKRYLEWCRNTNALLPKFRNWKAPKSPFSLRQILQREFRGLLLLVGIYLYVGFAKNIKLYDWWGVAPFWLWGVLSVAIVYCGILIALRKSD